MSVLPAGPVWDFSRMDTKTHNCLAPSSTVRCCPIAVQDDCTNFHQLYREAFISPCHLTHSYCQTCIILLVQWEYCFSLHLHGCLICICLLIMFIGFLGCLFSNRHIHSYCVSVWDVLVCLFLIYLFFFLIFIYVAGSGLGCSRWVYLL